MPDDERSALIALLSAVQEALTAPPNPPQSIEPPPNEPALVPLWPTAARRLGLTRSTAYRYAHSNVLPTVRFGTRIYMRTADLHRIASGHERTAA